MSCSNWHLQRWFNEFNKRYFNNELPRVKVRFGFHPTYPSHLYMGFCDGDKIIIRPWLKKSGKLVTFVLLHEMVHLRGPQTYGHGPQFVREMRRLHRAGAFDCCLYNP